MAGEARDNSTTKKIRILTVCFIDSLLLRTQFLKRNGRYSVSSEFAKDRNEDSDILSSHTSPAGDSGVFFYLAAIGMPVFPFQRSECRRHNHPRKGQRNRYHSFDCKSIDFHTLVILKDKSFHCLCLRISVIPHKTRRNYPYIE